MSAHGLQTACRPRALTARSASRPYLQWPVQGRSAQTALGELSSQDTMFTGLAPYRSPARLSGSQDFELINPCASPNAGSRTGLIFRSFRASEWLSVNTMTPMSR